MHTNILPASGKLIGLHSYGDIVKIRDKATAGTIPATGTRVTPTGTTFNIENVQSVTVLIDLTLGSLTLYRLIPVYFLDIINEYFAKTWLYSAANNRFEADANLEYIVTLSGKYIIQIPTFGAKYFDLYHDGDTTVTGSSVGIWFARNWCIQPNLAQLPN